MQLAGLCSKPGTSLLEYSNSLWKEKQQPIFTACSPTMGWEILFWLFVTFVEGFPKWQAISCLHFPFPMGVTGEKLSWVDFSHQTHLLQISISSIYSYNHVYREASLSQRWTSKRKGLLTLRRICFWNTWKYCSWCAGPWLSLSCQWCCCSKRHLASTLTRYKLSRQQHSLCFPQLWNSLVTLPEKVWAYWPLKCL